ncbi:hypothetical protein BT96DRAFT_688449 [Gymnopus androsaceus JB14]|uniref:Uncharacterized protein n=1 Tax=Gymnopus androsaceus JB14 TaxID=1447944 RepID=A0A6A4HRI8_9AGAR|nr:hypothetical protein BT96DRAFT_688449 [Gymnopus androsaceus JB14]
MPLRTSNSLTQPSTSQTEVKEVVLNGVAFQSSGRSLVRKDLHPAPQYRPRHRLQLQQHSPGNLAISSQPTVPTNRNLPVAAEVDHPIAI